MESTKKQQSFIYLDRNGFYFYQPSLPTVVSLAFLEGSVKDLDVINGASVFTQIKSFIDQYGIGPAAITIIASPNVTFEKDITGFTPEQMEEEVRNFVDTIPFESVLFRKYPIENGVKVIGINEDLYTEIKVSFEKSASTVDCVVPYQLIGSDQSYIRNLTTDSAMQLVKRLDHFKQFTLLSIEKPKNEVSQNTEIKNQSKTKKSSTRLIAMVGIFTLLIIILAVMLLRH